MSTSDLLGPLSDDEVDPSPAPAAGARRRPAIKTTVRPARATVKAAMDSAAAERRESAITMTMVDDGDEDVPALEPDPQLTTVKVHSPAKSTKRSRSSMSASPHNKRSQNHKRSKDASSDATDDSGVESEATEATEASDGPGQTNESALAVRLVRFPPNDVDWRVTDDDKFASVLEFIEKGDYYHKPEHHNYRRAAEWYGKAIEYYQQFYCSETKSTNVNRKQLQTALDTDFNESQKRFERLCDLMANLRLSSDNESVWNILSSIVWECFWSDIDTPIRLHLSPPKMQVSEGQEECDGEIQELKLRIISPQTRIQGRKTLSRCAKRPSMVVLLPQRVF